jgi:hypothetical protein
VKPIPAIAPPPTSAAQPTGGRTRPRLSFVTSQVPPTTPTGFPSTYPIRIPSVIVEVNARPRKPGSSAMPAFASAKSGTIT